MDIRLLVPLLFITSCSPTPLAPTVVEQEIPNGPTADGNSDNTNNNTVINNITVVVGDPATQVDTDSPDQGVSVGSSPQVTGDALGTFCPIDTIVRKDCSANSWLNCDCVPDSTWLATE